jgi:uncharacterized protein DUF6714
MTILEERIEGAFANIRYPGDDNLTVYDHRGREHDDTFKLLRGKTWQEFPLREFMSGDTPIPDLTPEAFHYYMPALLTGALNGCQDLSSTLVFYFSPSSYEQLAGEYPQQRQFHRSNFSKRVALFSAEQRRVIADVFREFARRGWEETEGIREAVGFLGGDDTRI